MLLKKLNIFKRLTRMQITGYILSCLVPMAIFILGIVRICSGWIINLPHLLVFVLLPCAAFAWNFKLVSAGMSVFSRAIIILLLLIVFLFAAVTVLLWGKYEKLFRYKDEQVILPYTETAHRQCNVLPNLSDIASPEQIEYCIYNGAQVIFLSDSYTLICRYNEADYAAEMTRINESYVFQQKSIQYNEHLCQPSAELGDYTFRMLDNSHVPYRINSYPKLVGLIGTNDHTREIIYMYFYDPDLDYIDSLPDFIVENCGWKYIR